MRQSTYFCDVCGLEMTIPHCVVTINEEKVYDLCYGCMMQVQETLDSPNKDTLDTHINHIKPEEDTYF